VECRSASWQMADGNVHGTLAGMAHTLSSHATTPALSSRIPAGALTAGRFALHFGEMVLAMYAGMLIYMPLESLVPPALQGIGMALFMAWPMVAWMRIRGHGWRHGFEMALAMLVPWAAVVGLNALGANNVLPWLKQADGPAMYLGMLGIMLVRREHYTHGGAHAHAEHHAVRTARRFRFHFRPLLLGLAYFTAVVLVPLGVGLFNLGSQYTAQQQPPQGPTLATGLPPLPVPDPTKKIAVVLSSTRGSEITDTLPTFEVLADSGIFNVYSVAPERTVLPLVSEGFTPTTLDFIPHFSFAEYDSQIGRAPDLILIPGQPWYTPEQDGAMVDWIRLHAGPNTTLVGICIGGIILADTGLMDGHTATTNAGVFYDLASKHPSTTWVPNVRWYDDGKIITSTTLASGIDATLHVVDRFAGRATALDVARQIGYTQTQYLDNPSWTWPSEQYPTPRALDDRFGTMLASAAFTAPQHIGVPLFDGVSEAGLAGLLDPSFGSLSNRTYIMAPERSVVRSRNGFLFVPRYDFSSVPSLDRVLVPAGATGSAKRQVVAAWSANASHRPVEDIFQNVGNGETAYQATFEDIAQTRGIRLASADASILFYALDASRLYGADRSMSEVLTPLLLSLLGGATVFGITHLKIARRARFAPVPQSV
jgi:AraC family transcriptional regulator, transcriptional activator FtrA